MTTRRSLAGAGRIALAVAALAVSASPPPAEAQSATTIVESGWWTRRPSAAPLPPGGFEVAEAPDDDLSVAALRVAASGRVTRATLVLSETGGTRQDMASLRVCPTTSNWKAANPGAFAERPAPNCSGGGIALARGGASWSADVLPLLGSGATSTSLMVVPGPPRSGLPVDGFQVVFAKADLDVEVADDDSDEEDGESAAAPPRFPSGSGSDDGFGFGLGAGVDGTPSFGPELGEQAPEDGPGVTSPVDGDGVASPFRRATGNERPEDGAPWIRLPVLAVLASAVGAAVAFGRRHLRDRGLLPSG